MEFYDLDLSKITDEGTIILGYEIPEKWNIAPQMYMGDLFV